ncbi:hypothetical protein WR25_15508 [Diploscapter pachys]|uniref:Dynein assembly factor 1, axonemal homolog n=1 Tax=Diploscapter pachys TaxID=2018661 RepID=A0A2A2J3N3_9BILA|nr:hypothetical protein WR25_15508 [Diploscapter pachys]
MVQAEIVLSNDGSGKLEKEIRDIEVDESTEVLDFTRRRILRVWHFEPCQNLRSLTMRWNLIKKIENLDCLGSTLTKLNLYDNQLTELEYLELGDNRIKKIGGLENNIKLKQLFLGANQIRKIEGLNGHLDLYELSMPGNAITEIEGLENLPKLRFLSIAQNGIRVVKGLENQSELINLDLNDNLIEKLENLDQLQSLTDLMIRKNKISDWQNVKVLQSLKKLNAIVLEMNPIYSSEHFYKNRIREILPNVCFIDGLPVGWVSGDPYQPLPASFYSIFESRNIERV